MRKFKLTLMLTYACTLLFSQECSVYNIFVLQRIDGTGLVDVSFALQGPDNPHLIQLEVTVDGGVTYEMIPASFLSGDLYPVTPGTGKYILWDANSSHPDLFITDAKLRITATVSPYYNACPGTPGVTDIDGNYYGTVRIGNKCWMKENLRVTRNSNGVSIARTCYDNSSANCRIYGGLYSWETIMDGASSSSTNPSGVQGICPSGWHVPSDAEWAELITYLCTTYSWTNNMFDAIGLGCQLRSCRKANASIGCSCTTNENPRWDYHSSYHGTNAVGFSALPSGGGNMANWWSATQRTSTLAWRYRIRHDQGEVNRDSFGKSNTFSLRCVKN